MKSILTILAFVIASATYGQTPVNLNIFHKLGAANFAFNQASQNNTANGDFKLTRMEYYLTQFSIIHDGGTITAVPNTVVALVNAGTATSIALGSFNVTNIEGVKFHVGVHTPINHADPALQAPGSPLAYQSPSMHWGWTSGYRFIALEGKSGTSLNQTLELHGLGDVNYFETTVLTSGLLNAGEFQINVNADYSRGLENITISSGLIVHAENQQAAQMVVNFKNYVFSGGNSSNGLAEESSDNISIYPVPSYGAINVLTSSNFSGTNLRITSIDGKLIGQYSLQNGVNQLNINLVEKGAYFLNFYNQEDKLYSRKVINN